MLKVVTVEKLGAICAFKPTEIQVVKEVYDKISQGDISDFEVVLNETKKNYESKVAAAKANGEKVNALSLKAEAINEVLMVWMQTKGYSAETEKKVVSRNPRIPKDNEKIALADVKIDKELVAEFYDNFPSDILDDSVSSEEVKDQIEDLFDGEADLFGDDVFVSDIDSNGIDFSDEVDIPSVSGFNFNDLL